MPRKKSESRLVITITSEETLEACREEIRALVEKMANPEAKVKAVREGNAHREPREFWVNVYPDVAYAHPSKDIAKMMLNKFLDGEIIHVREVID